MDVRRPWHVQKVEHGVQKCCIKYREVLSFGGSEKGDGSQP